MRTHRAVIGAHCPAAARAPGWPAYQRMASAEQFVGGVDQDGPGFACTGCASEAGHSCLAAGLVCGCVRNSLMRSRHTTALPAPAASTAARREADRWPGCGAHIPPQPWRLADHHRQSQGRRPGPARDAPPPLRARWLAARRSRPQAGRPAGLGPCRDGPGGRILTPAAVQIVRDDKQKEARLLCDDDPAEPLDVVDDERLRLIFTCCHPALAMQPAWSYAWRCGARYSRATGRSPGLRPRGSGWARMLP
jgi:hypothetical protein